MQIKVIGHRGLGPTHCLEIDDPARRIFPENSLAAFQEALDKGADGIEVDVLITKDGTLVALHDRDIWKYATGGAEPDKMVDEYTYQDIRSLDVGGGHTVPTILEVIDIVADRNAKTGTPQIINFDIKDINVIGPLLETLDQCFKSGNLDCESVFLCSYNWDALRSARSQSSQIQLAACLKTVKLFGKDGVHMPDYTPIKDHYVPAAIENIAHLNQEIGLFAVDCAMLDVRMPLIQFASQNKIAIAISTGNARTMASTIDFRKVSGFIKDVDLPLFIFKADEPGPIKHSLKNVVSPDASRDAITYDL